MSLLVDACIKNFLQTSHNTEYPVTVRRGEPPQKSFSLSSKNFGYAETLYEIILIWQLPTFFHL